MLCVLLVEWMCCSEVQHCSLYLVHFSTRYVSILPEFRDRKIPKTWLHFLFLKTGKKVNIKVTLVQVLR